MMNLGMSIPFSFLNHAMLPRSIRPVVNETVPIYLSRAKCLAASSSSGST
jgi:hypothetical protein